MGKKQGRRKNRERERERNKGVEKTERERESVRYCCMGKTWGSHFCRLQGVVTIWHLPKWLLLGEAISLCTYRGENHFHT